VLAGKGVAGFSGDGGPATMFASGGGQHEALAFDLAAPGSHPP
jgi:hypothetical protein